MKKKSEPTSFRLSEDAMCYLLEMATRRGINKSAMLEILIRDGWNKDRKQQAREERDERDNTGT